MIVISGSKLIECVCRGPLHPVTFVRHDGGDVYTALNAVTSPSAVCGTIVTGEEAGHERLQMIGEPGDHVRVFARIKTGTSASCSQATVELGEIRGFVLDQGDWREDEVLVVPVEANLYSRHEGLFETRALADASVFVAGLGSGGGPSVIDIARLGVRNVDILDHERLDVGNIVRHPAGLSDVGRLKTNVMAEMIHNKNPFAHVGTWNLKISWDTMETVRPLVRKNDITLCATDDRESRRVLNRLCVEEGKPCIFAGAFRRAYGGQILFVRPHETLCYECFLGLLPTQAADQEISSHSSADRVAYSDRPVPIEPGLSTDIAPLSNMVSKLILRELLKDKVSTLHTLDADLVAPWYLWLNRREEGTDYEHLKPLGFDVDGMRILRWYGIAVERDPACPVCGNFITQLKAKEGVDLSDGDIGEFASHIEKASTGT